MAVAAIINARSGVLYGERDVSEAEAGRWIAMPQFEARVAETGGHVVGYLDFRREEGARQFPVDIRIDPRDADEATMDALLVEAERLAAAQDVPDAVMRAYADKDETAYRWDFHRISIEEWRSWTVDRDDFDPELYKLAEDGGELAGLSMNQWHWSGDPAFGWVGVLGVRKPWRKRGLGRALLLHSFGDFRDRGAARVGLGVDAENTTGAVRLYESAGMHVVRRMDTYERPLA